MQTLEPRILLSASPIAMISQAQSIDEGQTAELSAAGSYDPDAAPLTYSWDLNQDGIYTDAWGESITFDAGMWAVGTPDGTAIPVSVEVSDGIDPPAYASSSVTVHNLPPSITSGSLTATANPGEPVDLSLSFFDPGTSDTHTVSVDWGDGFTEVLPPSPGTAGGTHTYTAPGTYAVAVTITDSDNATATWNGSVLINEPTFTASNPATVHEGEMLSLSVTASTHIDSWLIEWGDGTSETASPGSVLNASHTYVDDPAGAAPDIYSVSVTASLAGQTYQVAPIQITVNNIAPMWLSTPTLDTTPVFPGDTVHLSAMVTDPGLADTLTCTIDWGDGTAPVTGSPAGDQIQSSHMYSVDGSYTVSLTVSDDDGGQVTWQQAVTVNPIDPAVTAPAQVNEGEMFTLDLSSPASVDSWDIVWGDGTTETVASPGMTVSVTHTYADDDPTATPSDDYTIQVTANRAGQTYSADPQTITVNNIAPTWLSTPTLDTTPVFPGDTVHLSATVTDPGLADTLIYTINWGDGTASTGSPAGDQIQLSHMYSLAGSHTVSLTVTDDDGGQDVWAGQVIVAPVAPSITIDDVSVQESAGTATVTVSLSETTTADITVAYSTADGTAESGQDYMPVAGSVTILAGSLSAAIEVQVEADGIDEYDEEFFVDLSNPSLGTIEKSRSAVAVIDSDGEPELWVDDVTVDVNEGEDAVIELSLTHASAKVVTVVWTLEPGGPEEDDVVVPEPQELVFEPGVIEKTVTVQTVDDDIDEYDEYFVFSAYETTNATASEAGTSFRIIDNDPEPILTFYTTESVPEGDTIKFPVRLEGKTEKTVSVKWHVQEGAGTATPGDAPGGGNDFKNAPSDDPAILTFNPEDTVEGPFTVRFISLDTFSDNIDEETEDFFVVLVEPENATLDEAETQGFIDDVTPTPQFDISSTQMMESDDPGQLLVTLSGPGSSTVTVNWTTRDGTATVADGDYGNDNNDEDPDDEVPLSGTLTWEPGTSGPQPIPVSALRDGHLEPQEYYFVDLSNPVGALISSATGTVTIDDWDTANNQPPVAVDDFVTIEEDDDPVTIDVLANDYDDYGQMTITANWSNETPDAGEFEYLSDADGFRFTPALDFVGTASLQYEIQDDFGLTNFAHVFVTMTAVNDAPVANEDAVYTGRNQSKVIYPLNNDTDVDLDPISLVDVQQPSNGTVEIMPDGRTVRYTPDDNFIGVDTFTYSITDGVDEAPADGEADFVVEGTVSVYVAPLAEVISSDDTYSISHGDLLLVHNPYIVGDSESPDGIIANDHISRAGLIRVALHPDPAEPVWTVEPSAGDGGEDDDGSLTLTAAGAVMYRAPDKLGTYTFQYVVSSPVFNTSFTALPPVYTVAADGTAAEGGAEVLTVEDGDGNPLYSIDAIVTTGVLLDLGPASIIGLPVLIEGSNSNVGSVTIEVTNAKPVAQSDSYSTSHNTPLFVNFAQGLLANDSDADAVDQHRLQVEVDPESIPAGVGELTVDAGGSLMFLPDASYVGSFSFNYRVTDGFEYSNTATVTIDVTNSPPVAAADSYSMSYGSQQFLVSYNGGLLANDSDADNGVLQVHIPTGSPSITTASGGTVELRTSGAFAYTPPAGFSGTDTFAYEVTDGADADGDGESDTVSGTVTIDVNRSWPHLADDSFAMTHDRTLTVTGGTGLLANDSDVDGSLWTPEIVSSPLNGTVELHPNGGFVYRPNAGFVGTDMFDYRLANDGDAVTPARVTINVQNSAPVAADDQYSLGRDTILTAGRANGVLFNDSDDDPDDLLSASLLTGPAFGTIDFRESGIFSYTPDAGFTGTDSFTYCVTDGLDAATATVTLTINDAAELPVAHDSSYPVVHDGVLVVVTEDGLLSDFFDGVSEDSAALSTVLVSGPASGTLTLNAKGSFIYRPDEGFLGQDSFSYAVTDGTLVSSPAVVTITVRNEAPEGDVDLYETTRGRMLVIDRFGGVLVNDSDADSDRLEAVFDSGPTHGTLDLRPSGGFIYTPDDDFAGTDHFTYRVTDGFATSTPIDVSVTVLNEAPVAESETYTVLHHTADREFLSGAHGVTGPTDWELFSRGFLLVPQWQGLLANDHDPDGDRLELTVDETTVEHGTLLWDSNGSFHYQPDAGFVGEELIEYTVSDGIEAAHSSMTITVVNSRPVAGDDEFHVQPNDTLTRGVWNGLLANDHDDDGDPLTLAIASGPVNGTLVPGTGGSFTYTPDSGFTGDDTFVYTITDNVGEEVTGTVTIHVNPAGAVVTEHGQQPPAAADDAYSLLHDTTLVVRPGGRTVLRNDRAFIDSPLAAQLVTDVQHGTLALGHDGSILYTPDAGFVGADQFTYVAHDGFAASASRTVTLTVTNEAPRAVDDSFEVHSGESLTIRDWNGLLANDGDDDGDPLTVTVDATSIAHGSLTSTDDGAFVYTPDSGFSGTDSFIYTVSDGVGGTMDATVTIEVTNAVPTGQDDAYSLQHDGVLVVSGAEGILANDTDIDGDSLSWALQDGPDHGLLTSTSSHGGFAYTPSAGFVGSDSFTYTLSDGTQTSELVTVVISVDNAPPQVESDSYSVLHDEVLFIAADTGVLANDTDDDGDRLTPALVTAPANGSIVLEANGAFRYAPDAGFVGTDSFVYSITDGTDANADGIADFVLGTAAVTVTNQAPLVSDDHYSLSHDRPLNVTGHDGVLANDFDVDSDFLTLSLVSGPGNGTLDFRANGAFSYVPDAGFTGTDSFIYSVFDGVTATTATVTLNVLNQLPVLEGEVLSMTHDDYLVLSLKGDEALFEQAGDTVTLEGTSLSGTNVLQTSLLADDFDPDSDRLTITAIGWPTWNDSAGQWESQSTPVGSGVTSVNLPHGSLSITSGGLLGYVPDSGFVGTETFFYTVTEEGLGNSVTGEVTINVGNAAPRAGHDFFADSYATGGSVSKNGYRIGLAGSGSVFDNDSDGDGDSFSATLIAEAAHGTLQFDPGSGSFLYTPDPGFSGVDGFVYRLIDGLESDGADFISSLGSLSGNWDPNSTPDLKQAVLAGAQGFDPRAYLPLEGTDAEQHSVGVVLFHVRNTEPTAPSLTFHTIEPAAGEQVVLVVDSQAGAGASETPVGYGNPATVFVNASLADFVTDPDGETDLAFELVQPTGLPDGALATVNGDGGFTFSLDSEYDGGFNSLSFMYRVTDADGAGATGTVTIEIAQAVPLAGAGDPVEFRENEFEIRRLNASKERQASINRAKKATLPDRLVSVKARALSQYNARVAYETAAATASATESGEITALTTMIDALLQSEQQGIEAAASADDVFFNAARLADLEYWSTTTSSEAAYRNSLQTASLANDAAVDAHLSAHHASVAAAETAFENTAETAGDDFSQVAVDALLAFNDAENTAIGIFEDAVAGREATFETNVELVSDALDTNLASARDQLEATLNAARDAYHLELTGSHGTHRIGLETARTNRDAAVQQARLNYDTAVDAAEAVYLGGTPDADSTAPLDLSADPDYRTAVDAAQAAYDMAVAAADSAYESDVAIARNLLHAALFVAESDYDAAINAAQSTYDAAAAAARLLYRDDLLVAFNSHELTVDAAALSFTVGIEAASDTYIDSLQFASATYDAALLTSETARAAASESADATRDAQLSVNSLAYEQSLRDADIGRRGTVLTLRATRDGDVAAAHGAFAAGTLAADTSYNSALETARDSLDAVLFSQWSTYDATITSAQQARSSTVLTQRNAYIDAVFQAETGAGGFTAARRQNAITAYLGERAAYGQLGESLMEHNEQLLAADLLHADGVLTDEEYTTAKRSFLEATAGAELTYISDVMSVNNSRALADASAANTYGEATAGAEEDFNVHLDESVHTWLVTLAGAEQNRSNAHADAAKAFADASAGAARSRAGTMAGEAHTLETALALADEQLARGTATADREWETSTAAALRVRTNADAAATTASAEAKAAAGEVFGHAIAGATRDRTVARVDAETAFTTTLTAQLETLDSSVAAADTGLETDFVDAGLAYGDRLLLAMQAFNTGTLAAGDQYVADVALAQHNYSDAQRLEAVERQAAESIARNAARAAVAAARRDGIEDWDTAEGTAWSALVRAEADARHTFQTVLTDESGNFAADVTASADTFHAQDVVDQETLVVNVGHSFNAASASSVAAFAEFANDLAEQIGTLRTGIAIDSEALSDSVSTASTALSLVLTQASGDLQHDIAEAVATLADELGSANTALVADLNQAHRDLVAAWAAADEALRVATAAAGETWAHALAAANRTLRTSYSASRLDEITASYDAWQTYQQFLSEDLRVESREFAAAGHAYSLALAAAQQQFAIALAALLEQVSIAQTAARSHYTVVVTAIDGQEEVFAAQKGLHNAQNPSLNTLANTSPVTRKTVWDKLWERTQTLVIGLALVPVTAIIALAGPAALAVFGASLIIYFSAQNAIARMDEGLGELHAYGAGFLDTIIVSDISRLFFDFDLATLSEYKWAEGEKEIAISNFLSGMLVAPLGGRIFRGTQAAAGRFKGKLTSLRSGMRSSRNKVRDTSAASHTARQSKAFEQARFKDANDPHATRRVPQNAEVSVRQPGKTKPPRHNKNLPEKRLEADQQFCKRDDACFTAGHLIVARPADASVSGTWDTLPTDTDSHLPADAMTEIQLATASVAAGVVGARALRRRQRPGTLEQSPRPATPERSGIPAGGSGDPGPDDRELAMHRYFEQQVFDDLDRGFREPAHRPESSSHQPAAVDTQAASSSCRNWASTGWLATCLCIALLFGWRAAGHSGSLAQPVHAASASTPAISPAVPSAGSLPLVPIESVTTAHEVLAFDPATGRTAWKPVLQSFRRTTDHLRHLTVISRDGATQTFETTDEHPFWSVDAGGWVAAGSLQVGDRFQATDGSLHVLTATRYEPHLEGMPVFNFEVEDYHSYFVSAHGSRGPPLLVHNANCSRRAYTHSSEYAAKQEAYQKYVDRQLARGNTPEGIRAWSQTSGYDAGMAVHQANLRNARVGQEIHHFATNKHSFFTPLMERIASRYGLNLDGDWNKMLLPHRGRHTHGYHRWVQQGMGDAHRTARGDLSVFLLEYQRNVIDPVVADPSILYK